MSKPRVSGVKTLSQFKETYDKSVIVPKKIKEGLAKLGNQGWCSEADFLKLTGLPPTSLSQFRSQFEDFCLMAGGTRHPQRIWAGSKALAAKMRELV